MHIQPDQERNLINSCRSHDEKVNTDLLSRPFTSNTSKDKDLFIEPTLTASDSVLFALDDALNFAQLGIKALAQDEFTKCFEPKDVRDVSTLSGIFNSLLPTALLTLCYICGIFIRYFILFPLRLGFLLTTTICFSILLPIIVVLNSPIITRAFFLLISKCWVFTISGILRHHGEKPNLIGTHPHIFVSNHTSFIDFVLLSSHIFPHATVAQTHGGLFGIIQKYALSVIGSLAFQRNEKKDRQLLTEKLREHVLNINTAAPILIFPEGTCVNNEYTVLFHKGAFDLDVFVCPVAIKYNKKLVDPYWNTREQTFTYHILYLMTRWALVADIWWLPPQKLQKGENAIQFAERVKEMISSTAGLKNLSWDGYLKNYMATNDQSKLRQKTQKKYGSSFTYRIGKNICSPDVSPLSISENSTDFSITNEQLEQCTEWLSLDTVIDAKNRLLKTCPPLTNRESPALNTSHSIIEKMMVAKEDITRLWRINTNSNKDD